LQVRVLPGPPMVSNSCKGRRNAIFFRPIIRCPVYTLLSPFYVLGRARLHTALSVQLKEAKAALEEALTGLALLGPQNHSSQGEV
jgi:hypothetical protein